MAIKKDIKKVEVVNDDIKDFALDKVNYILIAISFIVIIIGLALMAGSSSVPEHYNPDIFSWRRIVLGPTIAFLGFVSIVFAIMYRKKEGKGGK